MRCFFTVFLVCLSLLSASAKTIILKGTVGTLPVFLKLESDGEGDVWSRYFYQSSLKDIVLNGTSAGGQYVLFANGDATGYDEKWTFRPAGGGYSGEWRNRKGKVLPLQLSPVAASGVPNPHASNAYIASLLKNEPFDYIRSAFLNLRRDSVGTLKGKSFVWFSETHCSMPFFRLGNGFDPASTRAVNPVLDGIHFEHILGQLGCASGFSYSKGEGILHETAVRYLSKDLLGFEVHSYADDCGGAHPDGGTQGYLIDLHNGRQYALDDILAFDGSVTTEAAGGFDAFSKYRSSWFAPALLRLQTAAHRFKKPGTEDDCNYLDPEVWDFPSWSVTDEGIEFTPIFPRVSRNCEESFLLPFTALGKYRNPKFPYVLAPGK